MVTFSFREYGENLGTRPLGKRVREQLMPLLEKSNFYNAHNELEQLW